MEFVRLKYANNKLINADIKEHREIINEYVEKKGFEYVGFIPTVFGPSGKVLELDLIFRKPAQKPMRPIRHVVERPLQVAKPAAQPQAIPNPQPQKSVKQESAKMSPKPNSSNDLYNDRGLDLILNGGDDDLLGEGK